MQVKHSRIYSKYRKQFCYLSFCHTDIIVHHSSEFLRYISGKYLPADPSLENDSNRASPKGDPYSSSSTHSQPSSVYSSNRDLTRITVSDI